MLSGLLPGEFAVFAADGAPAFVFLFCVCQLGFYACDRGVSLFLGEFTFPDGDDGPGEGVVSRERMRDML